MKAKYFTYHKRMCILFPKRGFRIIMKCLEIFNKDEWVDLKKLIPDAIINLRLFVSENFIGKKVDGYHTNIAYMKTEAAQALKKSADMLRNQGYNIVVYDSYRPRKAVEISLGGVVIVISKIKVHFTTILMR